MKILYCCHSDNYHIERWIPALQDAGIDVHILTLRPSKQLKIPQTIIKPIFSDISWFDFIALAPKIRDTFYEIQADLLFCSFGSTYGLSGYLSGIKPLFVQTWSRDIAADQSVSKREKWMSERITRKICRNAQGITTDGPHFKQLLQEKWLELNPEKIQSTWWGIDTDFWESSMEEKEKAKVTLKIPIEKTVITPIRGMFWYYRPEKILDAIKTLLHLRDDVFFLIPTLNYPSSKIVQTQLDALSQHPNVSIFDSFLDKEAFQTLLRASDFTLSVPFFDGISESVQEAIACGSILLLNPIPANLEFSKMGTKSFYTQNEQPKSQGIVECMLQALAIPKDKRDLFQQKNIELAKHHFDVKVTARSLISFFERMI